MPDSTGPGGMTGGTVGTGGTPGTGGPPGTGAGSDPGASQAGHGFGMGVRGLWARYHDLLVAFGIVGVVATVILATVTKPLWHRDDD